MPVSLAKVHKKINKKRGNSNTLNENSRDSQRLRRAGMRDGKLARVLAARMKANQPLCESCRLQLLMRPYAYDLHSTESGLLSRSRSRCHHAIERRERTRSDQEVINCPRHKCRTNKSDGDSFLRRDEEELETLKAERRPGRPASSRQDALALRATTEAKEYDTGFCMSWLDTVWVA